jgi:hypothetical protein
VPIALKAVFSFPGIITPIACTYTLSHGISPGVARIQFGAQRLDIIALGGDLVLRQNDGFIVRFPAMRVDLATVRKDRDGLVTELTLFDRRWAWNAGGEISGNWNKRDALGVPYPQLAQTPQQLATLCLLAMQEIGFDVSALPNNLYPEVNWDHANPAQELAKLCDQFGCRVVLTVAGFVQIWRTGVGAVLPTNGLEQIVASVSPPQRPDALKIVGDRTLYQNDWALEAVGRELDGRWLPIDKLSYKPAGGWGNEPAFSFLNVTAGQARTLAQQTIYRCYRLTNSNPDGSSPLQVPGYGVIKYYDQIELQDEQCDSYVDVPGIKSGVFNPGQPLSDAISNVATQVGAAASATANPLGGGFPVRKKPALVYGTFASVCFYLLNPDLNFPKGTTLNVPFSIHKEDGIVEFADPIFLYGNGGVMQPAPLILRTAAAIRHADTWQWDRYERLLVYPGGQWGTGAKQLLHDELQLLKAADYNTLTGLFIKVRDNGPYVQAQADYFLAGANQEFQVTQSGEGIYAGLRAFSPDGAIQQITWSVSNQDGFSTRVSRNNEFSVVTPSYKERRAAELLRGGIGDLAHRLDALDKRVG